MGVIPGKTAYGVGARAGVEGGAPIPVNDPYLAAMGEELKDKGFLVANADALINWARTGSLMWMTFGLACCAVEMMQASMPRYDLERFGLHFVASPRHADCLLVTGPVTRNMAEALKRTWDATPDPKIVVAAGDCARDGGIFAGSYAVVGAVGAVVPVDAVIPGCPPSPRALLAGLLVAIGRLRP